MIVNIDIVCVINKFIKEVGMEKIKNDVMMIKKRILGDI